MKTFCPSSSGLLDQCLPSRQSHQRMEAASSIVRPLGLGVQEASLTCTNKRMYLSKIIRPRIDLHRPAELPHARADLTTTPSYVVAQDEGRRIGQMA